MSALANCSHCTFFAKVTREKCFCWQALRNGRTLCIISCFFKQCENSVKIFHRRVFSPTSCSQSALQHGTVGDVPRRIVQLQVELSRYLPGSSLLAASLSGFTVWAVFACNYVDEISQTRKEVSHSMKMAIVQLTARKQLASLSGFSRLFPQFGLCLPQIKFLHPGTLFANLEGSKAARDQNSAWHNHAQVDISRSIKMAS